MASSQPAGALQSSESPIISVQELVKNPNITVPPCYIRSNQDPPNLFNGNNNSIEIPTIDLENLVSKEEADFELEKLHAICQEWGIFQLVNHGVRITLLKELKHEMLEFYKLPIEEKMKYKLKPGEFEGYGSRARSDGKFDWGDRFYMLTNPIHRRRSDLLPELPSSLRYDGKGSEDRLERLEEMFEDGMQSVRMTYYPPCPQPELVVGAPPHSDPTGITILHQVNGVEGLQIKKDGIWMPVNILPDALVVNVGDIMEIMSNGVYHSVEHKVSVNSAKERISIAFFVNPKFEAKVGPAASLLNLQNPPFFRTVGLEEYVKCFSARNKLDGKSYLEYMKIENGEGNRRNDDVVQY